MRQLDWSLAAVLACFLGCGGTEPAATTSDSPRRDAGARNQGGGDDDADDDDEGDTDDETTKRDTGTRPKVDAGTGDTGDGTCGQATFRTEQVLPDMMIVLDSSGSMLSAGVDRWMPSVGALKSLTSEYDKQVGFGLMTFPLANDKCGPGNVQVPIATGMASQIGKILDRTMPQGGTPTGQSLQAARDWFVENGPMGDTAERPRYVLLVTDGQPTCPSGGGSRVNDQDKQLAFEAIDALAEIGVKTYVVGYDAQLDPQFATVLGEFAKRGQTERYYPVKDEQSLVEAFKEISTAVISCKFNFEEAVLDPRFLRVKFDGESLKMGDPDGWMFNQETVVLTGGACAKLQGRTTHSVEVTLECTPVQ